jgi:uncharacterized metal-binding protein YceD (DUF177 family)
MGRFNTYTIPFVGLATGHHQFEYEIDDSFFALFENPVIREANIHVDVDLHKTAESLTLLFRFKGEVGVTCDRCLEPFRMPLNSMQAVLVKFGDPKQGDEDEVVVLEHGEHEINVAQHIYDFVSLQIPYRVVHPDKEDGSPGCDPEFLSHLSQEEQSAEPPTDPRWEALKKLKSKK